jgi:hypothetical protein
MVQRITILPDLILNPRLIKAGVQGRVKFNNTRTENLGGFASININQAQALRDWTFGIVPLTIANWGIIESFHDLTYGGAYGFLFEDPKDFRITTANGFLQPRALGLSAGTIGLGYGVPTVQLYKRVSYLSRTKDRRITRPRATTDGTILYRAGAPVTVGVSAGNVALDADTGIATFVADTSSTVTAVTVGATTAVTLTAGLAGLTAGSGNRLYLSGLTGADAAFLNGQSWLINSISGGGSNVYTLAVNTTGKTITPAGSGYKYPQASESLKWAGRFYVPVNFHDDYIDWSMVRPGDEDDRLFVGPSTVLDEVRE